MDRKPISRAGWLKYGLLVALIVCGGLGGLYLSGGWPNGWLAAPPQSKKEGEPAALPSTITHRFLLTSLDAKDTIEAPELAADSAGRVFLAWASKTGEAERTVFLTRTADAGRTFDAPQALSKGGVFRTGGKGKRGGYERMATPHLAAAGPELLMAWSEANKDGSCMQFLMATSTDAGAKFDPPCPVHQSQEANPTFTALGVGHDAELACAWLGGPDGQQPFAAVRRASAKAFEKERLIYPGQDGKGVCPCCPTAAAFAPDGTLYVAFRNINNGYRDIAISRLRPGSMQFEGPFPVLENTWKFDGCPHDGPSLAVIGDTLHVTWMDARSGPQRCYHARANLADMKFAARELNASAPGTQGNAKLFADVSGNLHAVWEESLGAEPATTDAHAGHQHGPPKVGSGGGRAVMYAVLPAGQKEFGRVRAVMPMPGAYQTRPVIVGTRNGDLFVAWNELDTTGKAVVVTKLSETGGK